jgi:hypothetical protein
MTKREFLAGPPVTLSIRGQAVTAEPRRVGGQKDANKKTIPGTGEKCGYTFTAKVPIPQADGSVIRGQFGANLTIIGSEDWAEGNTPLALPAPAGTALKIA